jgi:DNA polymerase/3'-5' exonuclease PolX
MYTIELEPSDITFIKACVLGTVRRAQETMKEPDAVAITNAATDVITRLNEARLTHIDVRFINVSIEKTRDYLLTDMSLPKSQRDAGRALGEQIQNKLAGVGKSRDTVFDA